jgi:hypothetical protein
MSLRANNREHIKEYKQFLEDERLFEMANVVKEQTGLPFIIWILPKMSSHGARIKVQGDYSNKLRKDLLFIVTISDEPKVIGDTGELSESDINLAKEFVELNMEVLLDYWNEVDVNLASIFSKLKKV